MARFNEILVGRYNRFLQKLLQMKGGPPAPQLSGDIQASLVLFSGMENRFLESWEAFGVAVSLAAVVAQTDGFLLRNPRPSNVIAVLERLKVASATAQEIQTSLGSTNTDLTSITTPVPPRDSRCRANSALIVSTQTTTPAAIGTVIDRSEVAAGLSFDVILDADVSIVLMPGQAIQVGQLTANSTLVVMAWWRERFLEESERT